MSEKPTLMQNHPIKVNIEKTISIPHKNDPITAVEGKPKRKKKKVVIKEEEKEKESKSSDSECESCEKGCHCKGWNKGVKRNIDKFY